MLGERLPGALHRGGLGRVLVTAVGILVAQLRIEVIGDDEHVVAIDLGEPDPGREDGAPHPGRQVLVEGPPGAGDEDLVAGDHKGGGEQEPLAPLPRRPHCDQGSRADDDGERSRARPGNLEDRGDSLVVAGDRAAEGAMTQPRAITSADSPASSAYHRSLPAARITSHKARQMQKIAIGS